MPAVIDHLGRWSGHSSAPILIGALGRGRLRRISSTTIRRMGVAINSAPTEGVAGAISRMKATFPHVVAAGQGFVELLHRNAVIEAHDFG